MQKKHIKKIVASLKISYNLIKKKLLSRCLGVHEFHHVPWKHNLQYRNTNHMSYLQTWYEPGVILLRSILLVSMIWLPTLEVLPEIQIIFMLLPSGTNWHRHRMMLYQRYSGWQIQKVDKVLGFGYPVAFVNLPL